MEMNIGVLVKFMASGLLLYFAVCKYAFGIGLCKSWVALYETSGHSSAVYHNGLAMGLVTSITGFLCCIKQKKREEFP